MITASNNLKFDNDKTIDYSKIVIKDNLISFEDEDGNKKEITFKKNGNVFFNGTRIYYDCYEKVACHTCNSACNKCAGNNCNNCTACNDHCNSCTACNSCWGCRNCNDRCNACTVCVGCANNVCANKCNSCVGTTCVSCWQCTFVHGNEGCYSCGDNYQLACSTCRGCNGCAKCYAKCYFYDGLISNCPLDYKKYYVNCGKVVYER